jgi:hypothetical protein
MAGSTQLVEQVFKGLSNLTLAGINAPRFAHCGIYSRYILELACSPSVACISAPINQLEAGGDCRSLYAWFAPNYEMLDGIEGMAKTNVYPVMDWEEIERAHFAQQHCSI